MRKVREFSFIGDKVVVVFDDGTTEISRFMRKPSGAVEIAGQQIGHAETSADTQLVVRRFFVDDYQHA